MPILFFLYTVVLRHMQVGPKFKKCLFPARNQPLENIVTRNICLHDLPFFSGVPGNRDRKLRYCSRIYIQNWFTLLNEQNLLLNFVKEPDL